MSPEELRFLADMVERGEAHARCDVVCDVHERPEERMAVVGGEMRTLERFASRTYEIRIETYTPWTDADEDRRVAQRAIRRLEGRRIGVGETDGMMPWNVDHFRNRR